MNQKQTKQKQNWGWTLVLAKSKQFIPLIRHPSSRRLVLYSYAADFIHGLLKKNQKKLARSFNFTFRDVDDDLSLNNSKFGNLVDRIYSIEFEIKDTTYTDRSASYLDLHFEGDSERRLRTKIYDTRMFPL